MYVLHVRSGSPLHVHGDYVLCLPTYMYRDLYWRSLAL